MTERRRSAVFFCGLVPVLVATALCLFRPSVFVRLEYGAYDRLLRSVSAPPPVGQIVIVDVDERSLTAIGQWPWPRDRIGQLIARLRDLGASTIAVDVIFAEADRSGGSEGSPDVSLADTLRSGGVILGYAMTFDRAPTGSDNCAQQSLSLAIVERQSEHELDPFFRATGAVCNLPILTEAAGASGFLNATPDGDGILRRAPLLLERNGRVYPSLALAAVSRADATREMTLRVVNANTAWLTAGGRAIPLDGKSNLLLRYRGRKGTFPYVSAADVLSGAAARERFTHSMVLVGTTALGTREVVATPLDTLFAGVEVQATVADNLLRQDFMYRPEHSVAIETAVVLGLGVAATLVVGWLGAVWGALALAACVAVMWGASAEILSRTGIYLSPLFPTLGLTSALAAMTVASVTTERRRADRAGEEKATSQRLMVQTLLSLTEVRDAETGQHSRRTQHYARLLAQQLATHPDFKAYLTPERIDLLSALAPLHDIGKVGVPDRLLQKPGALTSEELEEMRKHPAYGHAVLVNAEKAAGVRDDVILAMAKDIVYTHHEKWDGTGYPQGLRGRDIPIVGRLMAVVDVFDALTTRRLYQAPKSPADAIAYIVAGRGTHFDPVVVDAFVLVARHLTD